MYAQAEVPFSLYEQLKDHHAVRVYSDYFSALCPYHDDSSPSLLVYQNGFICMACNERGSLYKLAKRWGNEPPQPEHKRSPRLPFSQSELEDNYLDAHRQMIRRKIGLEYLHHRGLTDEVIEKNLIGYYKGFYTIPIFEGLKSDLTRTGIVVRVHPNYEHKYPFRYAMLGKSKYYLPPYHAKDSDYPSVIAVTFGIFDAMSVNMAGVFAISTVHGKGRLDVSIFDDVSSFYMIAVIPDKGEEDDARQLVNRLGLRAFVVNLQYDQTTKDPNDLWVKGVLTDQLKERLSMYHKDQIRKMILDLIQGGEHGDDSR